MGWRDQMPVLEEQLAADGGTHPSFSRQETRTLKRQLAREMSKEAKKIERREAKMQRKRRRAGLGPA